MKLARAMALATLICGLPATPDVSRIPARLRDLPVIDLASVVQNRTWQFQRVNGFVGNAWHGADAQSSQRRHARLKRRRHRQPDL